MSTAVHEPASTVSSRGCVSGNRVLRQSTHMPLVAEAHSEVRRQSWQTFLLGILAYHRVSVQAWLVEAGSIPPPRQVPCAYCGMNWRRYSTLSAAQARSVAIVSASVSPRGGHCSRIALGSRP